MSLQSQFLRGDTKLEAAAVSDPAHILPGATGQHVAKIHQALIQLDEAIIDQGELQSSRYGPSTANAVLTYKRKRNLINHSYQTQADNIVGRMTMASLDQEMLKKEGLSSGPTRIEPLLPGPRPLDLASVLTSRRNGLRLGFQVGASLGLQGSPLILPDVPTQPAISMTIPVNGFGIFRVLNGVGGTVACADEEKAKVFDPAEPLAHGGTMRVIRDPHIFHVRGITPGQTMIVATNKTQRGLGDILTLLVGQSREVTVAFHFLGGPQGVATTRSRASIDAAVAVMNSIYAPQTNITFRNNGIFPLIVPELAQKKGLLLRTHEHTPDWTAVTKNRSAAIFNVFFVGSFGVDDEPFGGDIIALTDGPGRPSFIKRDCIMQDNLRGIELGLALAHEAGHALGEEESKAEGDLMNPKAPGRHIPATAAVRMNANPSNF